jgi:hypothetical protein
MKKAVVFYGSMRELEMGSKSWHVLGEDVDYFVVTWDKVNTHFSDKNPSYLFDPSTFPVPVKASIIVDYDNYLGQLQWAGLEVHSFTSLPYILYHWSLVRSLPNISSYDKIIISRTDILFTTLGRVAWEPTVVPGKITFTGSTDFGISDWMLITDPVGLNTLTDIYTNGIQTKDFLAEGNNFKLIHHYLVEQVNADPEKFFYEPDRFWPTMPIVTIIRPNSPKVWESLPYGPLLAYLIMRHSFEHEVAAQTARSYLPTDKTPDELAIDLLGYGTDFDLSGRQ